jgi:hypothetical protein
VSGEAIEVLLGLPRLLAKYEVRRDLALCPKTPETAALQLLSGLYWHDLVRAGRDVRVSPRVRRQADLTLAQRLPGLAVGERVTIARSAGRGTLQQMRHDRDPRVFKAVLENPRLTEDLLSPVIANHGIPADLLRVLAGHRLWGSRYFVKNGVCRNPRTPLEIVLPLLPTLKKQDLRRLVEDPRVAHEVRQRARLLTGIGIDAEPLTPASGQT